MAKVSLAELEAVTTVARLGGFRAAARELQVSSSALSHAISALEERLGVRLFNRTTRSVALTDAGERFVTEVTPALSAIADAVDQVGEQRGEPTGQLRLNMAPGAARILFTPLLLDYMRRYPGVQVEIATDDALVDVMGQGFDAGVRLAEMVPPDMIAVPIVAEMRMVVVGSPAYFAGRPRPQVPQDLLDHTCIRARMSSGRIYHWEFERNGTALTIDVPGPLTLDDSGLMLEAALANAGLAFISEQAVAPALADGRLVQVLDDWTPPYPGLCLYYSGRRNVPMRLRALIDLIHAFRKSQA